MRIFFRNKLSRRRRQAILMATAPVSYWIRWGGDPEGLKKALTEKADPKA